MNNDYSQLNISRILNLENNYVKSLLISSVLAGAFYFKFYDIGLILADEGFLWYGSWQTSLGEIPLRDFQSYDPGRYYWIALFFKLFGAGPISLRASLCVMQIIAISFGLLILQRVIRSNWLLVGAALLLFVWMFPRWKIFESAIIMSGMYFAILLIEKPSIRQHFYSGLFIGIAAFFGRNHGVYNLIAFSSITFFLWVKVDKSKLVNKISAMGLGIFVGYLPMLVMLASISGFYESFRESIMFLFRRGRTNIPLPIPWPWTIDFMSIGNSQVRKSFLVGVLYIVMPLFYILLGLHLMKQKRIDVQIKAPLLSCFFIGIVYMHHAFARAGLGHLAQSMPPFLIGLTLLPFMVQLYYQKIFIYLLALVVIISIPLTARNIKLSMRDYLYINIADDMLWIKKRDADFIKAVEKIEDTYVKSGEELLIAPHAPALYPILGRKSPLWDIYFLFKETKGRQQEMISEMSEKNVNWVILGDIPLDKRNDLRFRNTHPDVWRHFNMDFERIHTKILPTNYALLMRK